MWFFGSNRAWRLFLLEPHVLSLPFFIYIYMPKIGGERVSFPGRGDDDDVVFIGVVVQGFATVVEKVGREHRGTNS